MSEELKLPNGHVIGMYHNIIESKPIDDDTIYVRTEVGEYHVCRISDPDFTHIKDISGESIFDLQDCHLRNAGQHELADVILAKRKLPPR